MVSKSFQPVQVPGQPTELKAIDWSAPPPNASMLAFGNMGVTADKVQVQGWLYDVKGHDIEPAGSGQAVQR